MNDRFVFRETTINNKIHRYIEDMHDINVNDETNDLILNKYIIDKKNVLLIDCNDKIFSYNDDRREIIADNNNSYLKPYLEANPDEKRRKLMEIRGTHRKTHDIYILKEKTVINFSEIQTYIQCWDKNN